MTTKNERPKNYYFQALKKLGYKVVKDEILGWMHFYYFNCGCLRGYSINPITMKDSENLEPCEKHKHLKEELD